MASSRDPMVRDDPRRRRRLRRRRVQHDRGHGNLRGAEAADIEPHDAIAPALPTYSEAVRIATERGLTRQPRIGFLKQLGVAEYVPVCERIVFGSPEELDTLAAAMA